MLFPDPLEVIIAGLSKQLGTGWVADRLPDPLAANLPAVWVNPLPGSTRFVPWGDSAPLVDEPAFDVDILAAAAKRPKALYTYAGEVRQALLALPSVDPRIVRVIEDVPLTKRPDWNPATLRVGGEYSLVLRRAL